MDDNEAMNEEVQNLMFVPQGLTTVTRPSQLILTDGSEPYDETFSFTNIVELQNNPTMRTTNKLVLFVIEYWKSKKGTHTDSGRLQYRDRSGRAAGNVNLDRLLFCMDVNAIPGTNIVILPVGRGQNPNLFAANLDLRDTDTFGECFALCVHRGCVERSLIIDAPVHHLCSAWELGGHRESHPD
jgi:hypothetical protein